MLFPFYKSYLPSFFKTTNISNTISASIYPWESFIFNKFRKLDKHQYWKKIIEVDEPLLLKTLNKLKKNENNTVIYLYEPECIKCRYTLGQINNLAKDFKDIKFMVVAFDDNKKRLSSLLNNFEKLYFKPLLTTADSYTKFKVRMLADNIELGDYPSIIFYNAHSETKTLLAPSLFIRNNLLRALGK